MTGKIKRGAASDMSRLARAFAVAKSMKSTGGVSLSGREVDSLAIVLFLIIFLLLSQRAVTRVDRD